MKYVKLHKCRIWEDEVCPTPPESDDYSAAGKKNSNDHGKDDYNDDDDDKEWRQKTSKVKKLEEAMRKVDMFRGRLRRLSCPSSSTSSPSEPTRDSGMKLQAATYESESKKSGHGSTMESSPGSSKKGGRQRIRWASFD